MDKKEDVRETAFKLGTIYRKSPCAYFYLKGWIDCILQRDYEQQKKIVVKPDVKLGST